MLTVYLVFSAGLHLVWEAAQLPLYTIWTGGSWGEILFAVLHCTAGDVLIAAATMLAAVLMTGTRHWPRGKRIAMPVTAILLALAYTGFSEWRNVYGTGAWAYGPLMPTITLFGDAIGLSPLLQWLVVPAAAFWLTRKRKRHA